MPIKSIPFEFIFDHLQRVDYKVKPMFGCYSVHVNGELCFFFGRHKSNPLTNGISIATISQHTVSLCKDFPKAVISFLQDEKCWLMISEELPEFESYCIKACELVSKGDKRIGR